MDNKKSIFVYIILSIIVLSFLFYKMLGSVNLEKKTYKYLETKGCYKKQIKNIGVKQSFINLLLSYDQWNIKVNLYNRYEYTFTYKNKKIVLTGLNDNGKLSKEDYQNTIERLENGELCNKEEDMMGEESKYILSNHLVGLKIKEKSLTNKKITLIVVNQTDKTYMYGEGFSIEYEKDNIWYQVNPTNELVFNLIGYYYLKPDASEEMDVDWSYFYDELMPGKYRIIKHVFLEGIKAEPENIMHIGVEFIIN